VRAQNPIDCPDGIAEWFGQILRLEWRTAAGKKFVRDFDIAS
jgi:hypothetical protein